jgi:hypothetical protein
LKLLNLTITGAFALLSVIGADSRVDQASDLLAELGRADARWSAGKPMAYEFTLSPSCEGCPPRAQGPESYRFRVEHGTGTLIDNVTPARRAAFETLSTVEGQLAHLRRALEQRPDSADIDYNPRLGYPVRVRIDMRRYFSDDELGFSISGFKVLSQRNRPLPNHVLQSTGGVFEIVVLAGAAERDHHGAGGTRPFISPFGFVPELAPESRFIQ